MEECTLPVDWFVVCILHMENHTSEKFITMLLYEGLCDRVNLPAVMHVIHGYIHQVESVVNSKCSYYCFTVYYYPFWGLHIYIFSVCRFR